MDEVKRLPLECKNIDKILGGGVEYGVITNFYGEAGAGKSNISLLATANALDRGEKVLFIDTEGSFSTERALQIYDKFEEKSEDIILLEPKDFREQQSKVSSIKDMEEDFGLIVIDSVVALYRIALNSDEQDNVNKKLAQQFAELSKISREENIPVLITTQVYSNFNDGGIELVSRDVARYWSKCLVKLEKTGENKRRAIITKHRSRPEGSSADFFIVEKGISEVEEKSNSVERSSKGDKEVSNKEKNLNDEVKDNDNDEEGTRLF